MMRSKVLVNTDPLKRCYNGCYYNHMYEWGAWQLLEVVNSKSVPDERLKFWRELNNYAVSERGESARSEFVLQD